MEKRKFLRRGWICGLISPVTCLVFILLQMAGVWDSGSYMAMVLACVLMVEMLIGTAAPFWWLVKLRQKSAGINGRPMLLIGLNVFAIVVSLVFFF